MTDRAWDQGMAMLMVSFPDREKPEAEIRLRSKVYREALNRLSDETWLYAVKRVVEAEKWFPTVACLIDYASDAPSPQPKGLLPEDTRTIAEKRADFQAGFQGVFREELRKNGIDVDALVSQKAMPEVSKA